MNRYLQLTTGALGVVLVGACSSTPASGGGGYKSATPTAPASVAVAQSSLGPMLVGEHGRALYLFEADTAGTSTCSGECAKEWPPLTTAGAPVAAAGVNAALLATTTRSDGTVQVTFNGHPLYYYDDDEDAGPGSTKGQGETKYGAKWYVLDPAGAKIDKD
jgi:predicted lipoprotein with Yx(FWY)xxD motif